MLAPSGFPTWCWLQARPRCWLLGHIPFILLLFQFCSGCPVSRYFPRCHLLEAAKSPLYSYTWRSIMAAMPILKSSCCWRVGNGSSIRVMEDKWIPNHPTIKVLHSVEMAKKDHEWRVADLIGPDLKWWIHTLISSKFHKEDAEAILKIPLSCRQVSNTLIWLHNKDGVYSCKSGYQVATQMEREAN